MRELLRRNLRFFVLVTLGGLVLRLLFLWKLPAVTADSFVYGDIAKNWLQHAVYGLTGRTAITPTYIRLPGYPAFLAMIFAIFGMEHYRAVLVMQIFVDIGTCFLIADLGRRLIGEKAAKIAFLFAAMCPFFANYAAAALTETWEIFFTVVALDLALVGLQGSRLLPWLECGLAIGAAMLLRPDGSLLLFAIGVYLIAARLWSKQPHRLFYFRAALVMAVSAIVLLLPWTCRNYRTFHTFQPLAPRYANDIDTFVPLGFERWVKTWIVDYASTEEVYWSEPGSTIDLDNLPNRAFDSADQRDETEQLLSDYNQSLRIDPELDLRFAKLAADRVQYSRIRYYVWLPLLRVFDMWLRPRTEILPCNTRWWEFDEQPQWMALMIVIGAANLLYIGGALLGLIRMRAVPYLGVLLTFVILRSAFLGSLENPETRYTLECYPVVILCVAMLFAKNETQIADRV